MNGQLNTPESESSIDGEALYNKQNCKQRSNDRGYRGRRREGKNNPLDADGKITQCFICGSCKYWACSCLHANESEAEEVQILLMTSEEEPLSRVMDALMAEVIGFVFLDLGCSKPVCRMAWLSSFLDSLDAKEKQMVKTEPSNSTYRFGDGRKVKALKSVSIPCAMAEKI